MSSAALRLDPASSAIRGAALKEFVAWYGSTHGRVGLGRALARLPASERAAFEPFERSLGIKTTKWYPAPIVHAMLEGLTEGLDEQACRELAETGAKRTLEASLDGFLATLFRTFASPQLCAVFGQRLWRAFFSDGQVKIRSVGERCHRMEVRSWGAHQRFLCQLNCAAGVSIYQAAGANQATTEQLACIDHGDDCCVYLTRW